MGRAPGESGLSGEMGRPRPPHVAPGPVMGGLPMVLGDSEYVGEMGRAMEGTGKVAAGVEVLGWVEDGVEEEDLEEEEEEAAAFEPPEGVKEGVAEEEEAVDLPPPGPGVLLEAEGGATAAGDTLLAATGGVGVTAFDAASAGAGVGAGEGAGSSAAAATVAARGVGGE